MSPLVSIIIINWNGGDTFKECLQSLLKITYPKWELIVVDNGSVDDSLSMLSEVKNREVKIINNSKNVGFAKANNQGYQRAKGEYVLLLNNDTKVSPESLSLLVERMVSDPSIGVIQPKIFLMDKPNYLDNAGSYLTRIGFLDHWGFLEKDKPEFKEEKEIFSAKGACMLIRKETIEKVGLFDEDFVSYFEESDFCWRVWLAGYRIIFYPQAFIYHKVGYTIKRLNVSDINYHYYKNRVASLIKNLSWVNLLVILPTHVFISVGIILLFLIKLKITNSLLVIKALLWNLANLPQTLKRRNLVQHKRKISDMELFNRLSHRVNWVKFLDDFRRVEEDLTK